MNQRINNMTNTDLPNGVPCGLQLPVRLLKEPRHATTETLVHRASLCLANGEPAMACALLRQLAWECPDNTKVLAAFGQSLLALGRYRDAEICFQHLLSLTPERWSALRGLARTLQAQSKWQEASEAWNRILWQFAGDVESRVELGWAMLALGDVIQARHLFRLGLKLDSRNVSGLRGMGQIALVQDDLKLAIRCYRRAQYMDPTCPKVAAELGWIWLAVGELDHASVNFAEALALDPQNARAVEGALETERIQNGIVAVLQRPVA
jgi:tetratricopeptide (TPR) repeat protein